MNEDARGEEWWELRLRPRAGRAEDARALLLELCPAGFVEEQDEFAVYLPDVPAALRACRLACSLGHAGLRPVRSSSWARWQDSFEPVTIGERMRIVPVSGASPDTGRAAQVGRWGAAGCIELFLEPGPAFGTGEHPTTAACLRYLDRVVRPEDRVVDVGTGSGILAIAAALLGAAQVLAVDVDPVACRVARRNLLLNPAASGAVTVLQANATHLLGQQDPGRPPAGPGDPDAQAAEGLLGPGAGLLGPGAADVVAANLTSALIRLLAQGLARITRSGGWLIASGLSWGNRPGVEAALRQASFDVQARTVEAGWATVLFQRGGA